MESRTGVVELYDPAAVAAILSDQGAILLDSVALAPSAISEAESARTALVEKLLKHGRTHYYVSRNDPWFRNNLAHESEWSAVEELMRKHQLLEDVRLQKAGRPEEFMRLTVAPDAVLRARFERANSTRNAVDFWAELLSI
jgi:hypothetical protein